MIRRYLPAGCALLALGALWWAYENITLLRGTVFWQFRYVTLIVGAFLLLTALEKALSWLPKTPSDDLLSEDDHLPPSSSG